MREEHVERKTVVKRRNRRNVENFENSHKKNVNKQSLRKMNVTFPFWKVFLDSYSNPGACLKLSSMFHGVYMAKHILTTGAEMVKELVDSKHSPFLNDIP